MSIPSSISWATEADADAIAKLSHELGYPVGLSEMQSRIQSIFASVNDLLVVSKDSSEKIVGWLQAHAAHTIESGFRVEIIGLIVSPASRRSGIARSLVSHAEHWANNMSAQQVVVRSNANRVESHAFYAALGYISTKTSVIYCKHLDDQGADEIS